MASGFKQYPFDEIEPKWQTYWLSHKTFRSPDPGEKGSAKPKYYVLDMFPYPSASGLHVGHLEGYTSTDILARYKRMRGFNVLHPMGWDAFGLPAEQHALNTGTHPKATTENNVNNFRRQIQQMGFSYDWDREVNTTDPHYYKWTQWIFTKLYEKGLAYEAEIPVNWCPELGTVLANEEVIDGKSERGNFPVIRKPMRQWVLKITAYADRLLDDLDLLDWPDSIKEMQRNWIGKSTGAEVDFEVEMQPVVMPDFLSIRQAGIRHPDTGSRFDDRDDSRNKIRVFTTRPDTLFGATYMVLSPEHSMVKKITAADQKTKVETYVEQAARKSDLERTDLAKEKTGVFTGAYAINPVNGRRLPIWIADYVLSGYGTGAIMAVPAHDERDFSFAQEYLLPILEVVRPSLDAHSCGKLTKPFTESGLCTNSTTPDKSFSIDGMPSDEAKEKITQWLEQKNLGKKKVNYKLRDWLFSRQRYWGEPIPVIHQDGQHQVVSEKELPILLPETDSYKPTGTGESPLAGIKSWVEISGPDGKAAKRETNTMPQWAGSCWYYLRYIDPQNSERAIDPKKEKYWMNVDLYVGGAEHAVLHLLYSRFWHKVLYDIGVVSTKEPFQRLINQGMILGEDNQKMSKSRGNVVNPDELVALYGADSIRLYEMFMGPLEMTKPWSTSGVEGVYRFLGRVWRLFIREDGKLNEKIVNRAPSASELKRLHQTIKKATEDMEGIRLNTAISAFMIFMNETLKDADYSKAILEPFVLLLAPFAPHFAEELWERLGHNESLAYEPWPVFDPKLVEEDEVELPVMVQGKVKGKITVSKSLNAQAIQDLVSSHERFSQWTGGKAVDKWIIVPGRVINLVTK